MAFKEYKFGNDHGNRMNIPLHEFSMRLQIRSITEADAFAVVDAIAKNLAESGRGMGTASVYKAAVSCREDL